MALNKTELDTIARKNARYHAREELKRQGWEVYKNAKNLVVKVCGVEAVIEAHFDRSEEAYRGKHPDFFTYARHWVWARRGRTALIDTETLDALAAKYPKPKSPRIGKGMSYWKTKTG